ncbi:M23 family metallopeptidase [Pelagibacteraceae bacterium]|jgi:murein DD-endopeptidase MepM/ murein hydrolase activator NlpD|nr:M23 family metallopeptidase [Pelagibacteraceae bacterium]
MKLLVLVLNIFLSHSLLYAVEFKGNFIQGSFILGKTDPKSKIIIDKKKIKVSKDGYFVFGLGRDRKNDVTIKVLKNKKLEVIVKKVYKKKYRIQKIDGLPKKQVTPPKEVYERIKKDNIIIGKARSIDSKLPFFKNNFIIPVENSIVTGVYGSQRILNGKPRRPHYGLDFAAPEGTPIKAMLDGVVTLSEPDLYFTGGTIIFDHGHGISTLYMHLKDVNVNVGENIQQGEIIGTIGTTGRSTGPHLDVRLNWFDVKLDPESVLKVK